MATWFFDCSDCCRVRGIHFWTEFKPWEYLVKDVSCLMVLFILVLYFIVRGRAFWLLPEGNPWQLIHSYRHMRLMPLIVSSPTLEWTSVQHPKYLLINGYLPNVPAELPPEAESNSGGNTHQIRWWPVHGCLPVSAGWSSWSGIVSGLSSPPWAARPPPPRWAGGPAGCGPREGYGAS